MKIDYKEQSLAQVLFQPWAVSVSLSYLMKQGNTEECQIGAAPMHRLPTLQGYPARWETAYYERTMEPEVRFELTTDGVQNRCTTVVLPWQMKEQMGAGPENRTP